MGAPAHRLVSDAKFLTLVAQYTHAEVGDRLGITARSVLRRLEAIRTRQAKAEAEAADEGMTPVAREKRIDHLATVTGESGSCRESDPNLWHADAETYGSVTAATVATRQAKAICRTVCPVREECLEMALLTKDRWGVYGGLTRHERDALRAAQVTPTTERKAA